MVPGYLMCQTPFCMALTHLSPSSRSDRPPKSSPLTPPYTQRSENMGYDVATSPCGNCQTTPHHIKKERPIPKIVSI